MFTEPLPRNGRSLHDHGLATGLYGTILNRSQRNRMRGCGLDASGSGQGQVARSCEDGYQKVPGMYRVASLGTDL
jgi:hypothetical protein